MVTTDDIQRIKELFNGDLLPIGTIIIFAAHLPPDGYIVCDGRFVRKDAFPKLYAIIGGIYGEDDESFGLPDLRGRFVRGCDTSNILDPQRPFGSYQDDAFQGHSHKTDWADKTVHGNGTHCHSLYGDSREIQTGSGTRGGLLSASYSDFKDGNKTSNEGWHTHTLPDIVLGDVCSNKYGKVKVSTETRPKNIALTYCIKVK